MLAPDTILQSRYRVIRQLGQGGMGTVYEANALRLKTTVAIKEAHLTEERLRKQFEREAQLLASLRHPALPRVIDHFDEGNGLFLVMDYVPGQDLWEQIERRNAAFPVATVLNWTAQLLNALEYLHNQTPPIIHRDIKPQNIKVTDANHVVLLDFGLAKSYAGPQSHLSSHASATGSVFGYTASYAPPEQIQGEGTDARSDIYSLAATIYNLLTNEPPVEALRRVISLASGDPDPLLPAHQLNPQIPASVSEVLSQAMAIARSKRYHSASEMREALRLASLEIFSAPAESEKPSSTAAKTEVLPQQNSNVITLAPLARTELKDQPPSPTSSSVVTEPDEHVVTETQTNQSAIPTVVLPEKETQPAAATATASHLMPETAGVKNPPPSSKRSVAFLLIPVIFLLFCLASAAALAFWKYGVGPLNGIVSGTNKVNNFTETLSKDDMQIILKDVNPLSLKQLADDPVLKQKQIDSIKGLLATANQAQKEGLANDVDIKQELAFLRAQVIATNYDREKNKDKSQTAPFSAISDADIAAYYARSGKQAEFDEYVKKQIEKAKKDGRMKQDQQPTAEQLTDAKDNYAKIHLYEEEANQKSKELGKEYNRRVELQVRLQQAQYLSNLYSEKVLQDKVKPSDSEIAQYIAAHPELDSSAKKAKAEEILRRVKSGEDFAKVAKEVSEDPGSKDKGGIYENLTKGLMTPEFEKAALALQPGQIADFVVESNYGYHIIKLERKGITKDKDGKDEETYDARHILISTSYTDPSNPLAPPMSMKNKAKADLEEEKQNKILAQIKADNPVQIEDFEVPKPSDEQLKKAQEQQNKMPTPLPSTAPAQKPAS